MYVGYALFVQYVFMFQWPRLPELWFSVRDYRSLEYPSLYELVCDHAKLYDA